MPVADFWFYVAVLLGLSAVVCSGAPAQTPLEKAAEAAGGDVLLDTPTNRLYPEAAHVADAMKDFLSTLSGYQEILAGRVDREDEIRQFGVKRGSSGFRVNGWRRKRRSTMESDILAVAFTSKLDRKAADMVHKIYTFLDDLQLARQYYEGHSRGVSTRSMERSVNPIADD